MAPHSARPPRPGDAPGTYQPGSGHMLATPAGGVPLQFTDPEGELRLRALIESAMDGVYRIDPYGVFTWSNSIVPRLLGLGEEGVVGRLYLEFVRRDYHEEGIALYKAQVRDRVPVTYWEFPAVRADGEELWIGQNVQVELDAGGHVTGLFAIARDITSRKRAELALRESEERHRFLSEHSVDMLSRLSADGIIRDASPVCHATLGRPPQQLIGMSLFQLCHPDDLARVRGAVARLRGGSTVETLTMRLRRGDGEWTWFESTMQAIRERDHIVEILAVSRDVTQRMRVEEERRRGAAMAAVARLAGGIAEEFGGLLARIQGVSDVLRERTAADDPRHAEILEIWRTSDRAGQLTRQLLALAGRQALRPEVVDLNRVLTDLEPVIARLLGPAFTVRCERDASLPPVIADPGQLEQAVLQLVRVSRRALASGGTITLRTAAEDDAGDGRTRRMAVLHVADDGAPMDDAARARLFEPFADDLSDPEHGLGLAGVYGVIVQSGGSIAVESGPGSGNDFVLRFPAA